MYTELCGFAVVFFPFSLLYKMFFVVILAVPGERLTKVSNLFHLYIFLVLLAHTSATVRKLTCAAAREERLTKIGKTDT